MIKKVFKALNSNLLSTFETALCCICIVRLSLVFQSFQCQAVPRIHAIRVFPDESKVFTAGEDGLAVLWDRSGVLLLCFCLDAQFSFLFLVAF